MTKFTEFYNRQKNVIKSSIAKRLEAGIPITEERDAFYKGELFQKYDIVESDGKQYTILEQGSNYYHVVDTEGNLSRKFAKQLTKISHTNIAIVNNKFHGYEIVSEEAQQYLKEHYNESADDVGILKQVKQLDEQMDSSYKAKDKMTVAKIIADAVGVPHDMVSTPENLVAAAIRKAKKDPKLVKNKEILANMLQIAREVGIKITDDSFDLKESEQLDEISDTKKIEYIHAARKSIKKLDSEGNTEKRDQRSVTANRTYSTISKDVKKKAFGDMRESEELDEAVSQVHLHTRPLKYAAEKHKDPWHHDPKHVFSSIEDASAEAKKLKDKNRDRFGGATIETKIEIVKKPKHVKESEELEESAAAMIAAAAALGKANRHGASRPKTSNVPDYSHVMGSYRRGKEDAKAGKPYNNPFELKIELGAAGNYDHNSYREGYHSKNESVELEEGGLSRKTIDSYLEKAKTSKPGTIHKAIKRFAGQERAQDRVNKDELEQMKKRLSLKEMRAKLHEEMGTIQNVDKANDTPDADVEAKPHQLPHGHTLNPSNEIHRKQLIRKVRGDD